MELKGAFTALVTPFRDGQIDEDAYRGLIEWQIEQGIHGLVPCGTTGEAATLSFPEQKRAVEICVDQAKGRVPVVAGAGSNSTQEAVELTRYAKEAGADAALMVTPYYNKPSPDGLVAHYKAVSDGVGLPIVVYNVPGRTGQNVPPELTARLEREVKTVIAIKEASADLKQVSEVVEFCSDTFAVLSGDDFTVLPSLAVGGRGAVSVVSNIVPGKMAAMCDAFFAGDTAKALSLHQEIMPLARAMFFETNPIPVKTSLHLMGVIPALELRLPLCNLDPDNETRLREVLATAKLI